MEVRRRREDALWWKCDDGERMRWCDDGERMCWWWKCDDGSFESVQRGTPAEDRCGGERERSLRARRDQHFLPRSLVPFHFTVYAGISPSYAVSKPTTCPTMPASASGPRPPPSSLLSHTSALLDDVADEDCARRSTYDAGGGTHDGGRQCRQLGRVIPPTASLWNLRRRAWRTEASCRPHGSV